MKHIRRLKAVLGFFIVVIAFGVGQHSVAMADEAAEIAEATLGDSLGNTAEQLGNEVGSNIEGEASQAFKDSLRGIFSNVSDLIKGVLDSASSAFNRLTTVVDLSGEDLEDIGGVLSDLPDQVGDAADNAGLKADTEAMTTGVKGVVDNIRVDAQGVQDEALNPAVDGENPSGDTDTPSSTNETPREDLTPADKVQDGLLKRAGKLLGGGTLKVAMFVGGTIVAAVLFSVPNWVIGGVQAALEYRAAFATLVAPQYFGGLWLRIPFELIDMGDLQSSFMIYQRITNPNPSEFSKWTRLGGVAGSWGGVGFAGLNMPWGDSGMPSSSDLGKLADDYFVTSGNGYCGLDHEEWGFTGITNQDFAGRMIHLNTGLEFVGDGTPFDNLYPYRQLMNVPGSGADQSKGYDFNDGGTCSGSPRVSIEYYLQKKLGPQLIAGHPFKESYDMYQGTGMVTATGGQSQTGASSWYDIFSSAHGENYGDTLKGTQALATKLWNKSSPEKNIFTLLTEAAPGASQESTLQRMQVPFTIGQTVVRDENGNKLSGGMQLQIMQPVSSEAMTALMGSSVPGAELVNPINAYASYVFQTADTPLAIPARSAIALQASKAPYVNNVVDYLVSVAEDGSYIPGLIPAVVAAPDGQQSTTSGYIAWKLNPSVAYFGSLINDTVYDASTGAQTTQTLSKMQGYSGPSVATGIFGQIAKVNGAPIIQAMTNVLTEAAKSGPFMYGGFLLDVVPGLDKNMFIYVVDPKKNNGKSTLKSNTTDYLVAITPSSTSAGYNMVQLPQTFTYFVSLISSTIYTPQLTPVTDEVSFSIYTGKSADGSSTIAGVSIGSVPTSDAGCTDCQAACTNCTGLQTNLGTLYQEYDVNPYNTPIIKVLPSLTSGIAKAMAADSTIQSAISNAAHREAVMAYVSIMTVSALQVAGLTPDVIKQSVSTFDTAATNNAIVSAIAKAGVNALKAANLLGSTSTIATLSPTDISKNLTDPSNSQGVQAAFAGIGSALGQSLTTSLKQILNTFGQYLGQTPTWSKYSIQLAQSGLIPTGQLYVYNSVQLGGETLYDMTHEDSGKVKAPYQTLVTNLINDYGAWKRWKLSQSSNDWMLYDAMGPFAFTTTLLPNVILNGFSLEAIKAGDYVYTTPTYPDDVFMVASSIGDQSKPTVSALEQFNPTEPQAYLISLISGFIYQRTKDADTGVEEVAQLQHDGGPLVLSNLAAITGSLKDAELKGVLSKRSSDPTWGSWHRYSYGNRILVISPSNLKKQIYIYFDVTNVDDFASWLQQAKQGGGIAQVGDFFVPLYEDKDAGTYVPVSIAAVPTLAVSMVSGNAINGDGPTQAPSITTGTQTVAEALLAMFSGKTVASGIKGRIVQLQQQNPQEAPASGTVERPSLPALSSATIAQLKSATPLPKPYVNLRKAGDKYYGVVADNEGNIILITDYFATTLTLDITDDRGNPAKRSEQIGISYDNQGNIVAKYGGWILAEMRAQAGIGIVDGAEVLGIPNLGTALPMSNPSQQLVSYEPAQKTTIQDGFYQGDYELYAYGNNRVVSVIAQYTAQDGTKRYVDMFSGIIYNQDGSAHQMNFPVLIEPAVAADATKKTPGQPETRIALMGAGVAGMYHVFGAGPRNYYFSWSLVPYNKQRDGASNWRNLLYAKAKPNIPMFNFWSDNSHQQYLALGALSPTRNPNRASLDITYPIATIRGTVSDPTKCTLQNTQKSILPPGALGKDPCAPQFTLATHTYTKQDPTKGTYLRVYQYVGSDSSTSGNVGFSATEDSWNANYGVANLYVIGSGTGKDWVPTRLYITSSADAPEMKAANMPVGSLAEFTSSDGKTFAAAPLPKDPTAKTQPNLTMNVTYYGNMTDQQTGADYVAFRDSKGTHYYIPAYQRIDGGTINEIQQNIGAYVTNTARGFTILMRPMKNPELAQGVQSILGVPQEMVGQGYSALIGGNSPFKTYDYGQGVIAYIYAMQSSDSNEPWYRPDAAFADLRSGVLYDKIGIPTGSALSSIEIQAILSKYGVKVPRTGANALGYTPPPGYEIVGATPTQTSTYLWYYPKTL